MAVTAKQLSSEERAEIINGFRQYHSPYLVASNIPLRNFNVKSVFTFEGVKVVGLFNNEFLKPEGFYFELVDSFLHPIDPKRTIYKVSYRENYEDLYQLTPKGTTYAVPLEELEVISLTTADNIDLEKPKMAKYIDPTLDEHHSKLTIRDIAAILWKKPVSNKEWLNQLVESNK